MTRVVQRHVDGSLSVDGLPIDALRAMHELADKMRESVQRGEELLPRMAEQMSEKEAQEGRSKLAAMKSAANDFCECVSRMPSLAELEDIERWAATALRWPH